jgi:hypothetical protein
MNNKVLLVLGCGLVLIGLVKPNISNLFVDFNKPANIVLTNYITDAPTDQQLLENALAIKKIFNTSNSNTKKYDCLRLSSLYADLALLIELKNEDVVLKDTASVKEANSLAGKMLKLDIRNKYLGLSGKCEDLVKSAIGSDEALLDDELRAKTVEAFRALSWACYKGSE